MDQLRINGSVIRTRGVQDSRIRVKRCQWDRALREFGSFHNSGASG